MQDLSFDSDDERLAHPIAQLIPEFLWRTVFKSKISTQEIAFATNDPVVFDISNINRKGPALTTSIINPHNKPEVIYKLAQALRIKKKCFGYAAALGNIELLRYLEKIVPETLQAMLAADNPSS